MCPAMLVETPPPIATETFVDADALQAYERHALHREVSAELAPLRRGRHVADVFVSPDQERGRAHGLLGGAS